MLIYFVKMKLIVMFDTDLSSVLGQVSSFLSLSPLSENLLWVGLGLLVVVASILYFFNQNKVKLPQNITEQAKNFTDKIQEETGELADIAQDKIDLVISEYKRLLPYVEELGLTVQGFSIEAGLLPQVKTTLIGSIDKIKPEAIERIKKENENNKLLVAILNAVLMAKKCHQQLESVYISILKDIVVDIKLGIPPSISIRFQ
ncbi:hypothetical protein [Phormidium tenue]|jgi:hypothetical protein